MKIQKKLKELEIMVLDCEINSLNDGSVTFEFDFYLSRAGISLGHVFVFENFDGLMEAEVSLEDIFLVKKLAGLENFSDEEVGIAIFAEKREEVSWFIIDHFASVELN